MDKGYTKKVDAMNWELGQWHNEVQDKYIMMPWVPTPSELHERWGNISYFSGVSIRKMVYVIHNEGTFSVMEPELHKDGKARVRVVGYGSPFDRGEVGAMNLNRNAPKPTAKVWSIEVDGVVTHTNMKMEGALIEAYKINHRIYN